MADRTVSVSLELVHGQYKRALAESAAATKGFSTQAGADLDRLGKRATTLGAVMTVGLTAPLVMLAKQAVDTAGTAGEAMNRMRVVFGENADEVEAWAQDSAQSMGLARHEAIGTAATFANMFTEMGLGDAAAREMSMGMVQLSSDIGSFRDVDPTLMLEKMRAGIVGEYEPLRALGIVLTDATVRQEAMRLGLADTADAVTTAGLVQARYSLILQATSKDQGDYARTAEDAVNAQRTATAAYKDAMVELGDNLLPLVAKGALAIADLAEAFGNLPEPVQTVLLGFGGLAAAAGPLLVATGAIINNLDTLSSSASMVGRAMVPLSIIGGLAVGWKLAFDELNTTFDELVGNVHELSSAADEALVAKFAEVGARVDDVFGDSTAQKAQLAFFKELADASIGTAERLRDALADQGEDVSALDAALRSAARGAQRASTDGERTAEVLEGVGDAAGSAASELDKLNEQFEAESAADAFNQQLLNFADRVRAAQIEGDDFATSLSDMNLTGLENRATVRDLAAAIVEYSNSAGASADVTAAMRAQLQYVLEQLGFNQAEAQRYIDVLLSIPTNAHTTITADGSQARSEIASVIASLQALTPWASGIIKNAWPGLLEEPKAPPVPQIPVGIESMLRGRGPAASAARDSAAGRARSAAGDAERAAEEAARAAEEARRRAWEVTDNAFAVGLYAYEDYLAELERRMAGEEHLTAEWMAIYEQRQRVIEEHEQAIADFLEAIHEQEKKQAEEVADFLQALYEAQQDALADLNDLLDREAEIRSQMADAQRRHRDELREIEDQFRADRQTAIDERRRQLSESLSLEERFVAGWANSVTALARNAQRQAEAIIEWQRLLAEARQRGLSEDVVDLLGLGDGPQALAQLRQVANATDAQIADLNASVAARQDAIGDVVSDEAKQTVSALGKQLREMAEANAAEVEALNEAFLAEQRELRDELAALGMEQGRDYMQAIEEGLRSGLPGVRAQVRALEKLLGSKETDAHAEAIKDPKVAAYLEALHQAELRGGSSVNVAAPRVQVYMNGVERDDVKVLVDGRLAERNARAAISGVK